MRFTDLFIRRPVLAVVVNVVIVIAGLQAVRSLNVRQYPRNEERKELKRSEKKKEIKKDREKCKKKKEKVK